LKLRHSGLIPFCFASIFSQFELSSLSFNVEKFWMKLFFFQYRKSLHCWISFAWFW
jgi:hypothetical protein